MSQPKKVAVLGGGIGSLSALFELTALDGWQDRFDFTVYQMGWQIGGKGASGRNMDDPFFCRSEEHGLHVWLGFYDNAFDIVMRCYEELDDAAHKFTTWTDAFDPLDKFVLVDGGRNPWDYPLPPNASFPGKRAMREFVHWSHTRQLANMLAQTFESSGIVTIFETHMLTQGGVQRRLLSQTGAGPGAVEAPATTVEEVVEIEAEIDPESMEPNEDPDEPEAAGHQDSDDDKRSGTYGDDDVSPPKTYAPSKGNGQERQIDVVVFQIARQLQTLPNDPYLLTAADRRLLLDDLDYVMMRFNAIRNDNVVLTRQMLAYWELFEIGFGMLRGMIADGVFTGGYSMIENVEWTNWLLGHGVLQEALDSPPAQAAYDLVFGYDSQNADKRNVSAAVGTHCLLRMLLDYRGSVAYELKSGMGEAVFTPLFLVLKERGVKFEFFHRIDRIRPSADNRSVGRIDFTRQARIKNGASYEPLVMAKGLKCWPTKPRYAQLEGGEVPATLGLDSPAADGIGETGSLVLGTDFDEVLLNIPLPALKQIAADLAAVRPDWQQMLNNIASTATMSAQLWMEPTTAQLGFQEQSTLLGAYDNPYDTVWDGDEVIKQECFPDNAKPGACLYLCGSVPANSLNTAMDPGDKIRELTQNWLGSLGPTIFENPLRGGPFDWNNLYDPTGKANEGRLQWQHVSANVEPWQHYIQSFPGTANHRLRSDQSGFDNLYLAGDWTRTALNAGCMEAAVMSGLRAARGMSGADILISGEDELTGEAPSPVDAIKRRISKIDDGVGSVDAIGAVLALPTADVQRMLPRGLTLLPAPNMPPGTHPLGVLFCRHWDVRPALAPGFLGASYDELAFALPYVQAPGHAAGVPCTVLPLLMLDDPLAAGGGFLLGFNKKLARLTVRSNQRRAASAFRGISLLDFETAPAGAAGPADTFEHFDMARQIFELPVIVRRPGGWRRVGMDFNLENANVTPLAGTLRIHREFLDGLTVNTVNLSSIESSVFGAFGFTSEWYLDSGVIPTQR